jgi:hypothetical protein
MSILGRVVLKSGLGDHAPHRRGLDICVFARKANAGKRGPGRDETAPRHAGASAGADMAARRAELEKRA